jgi:putative transposase
MKNHHQQWYGSFSVSKTDVKKICKYILNQPVHHKIHTFDEEYLEFIRLYQQTINPKESA